MDNHGAKLLRQYRDNAGLSIEQLAKVMSCTPGYIGHLEAGRKLPATDEYIRRLAAACHRKPDDLIAAFAHDRANRWLNKRPDHISPETAAKLAAILDQEPVAA